MTLLSGRFIRWADMAFLALGSMLPDIIDKPLGLLAFGTPAAGRTICHTLLFLLVLGVLAVYMKDFRVASVFAGVLAHLTLDSMWQSPVILLWPLLGNFPLARDLGVFDYMQALLYGLRNPMVWVPEMLGLAYLIFYAFESRSIIAARWGTLLRYCWSMEAVIQTLLKGE
ncbi:MAG: metal-dependent hydrolase [Methanotrichaceae archaeon]